MARRKNTDFMIAFVKEFTNGSMSRADFELDYDGYVIDKFPGMEKEAPSFAERFAATVDTSVDFARRRQRSDDEFRDIIADSLSDLLDDSGTDLL